MVPISASFSSLIEILLTVSFVKLSFVSILASLEEIRKRLPILLRRTELAFLATLESWVLFEENWEAMKFVASLNSPKASA